MTYDASDRRHVRQASKSAQLADTQRRECIGAIMSIVGSRAWMHDLLTFCNVFATTFSGNALHGAFNEGSRNVGLRLLNDIMSTCPDLYVLMMREANERNIVADVRRNRSDDTAVGNGGYTASEHDDFDGDDAAV